MMRVGTKSAVTVLLALFLAVVSLSGQVTSVQDIKIPPLPPFHPQEPTRVELPNGMVIFLQPDRELPLISGFARIRGGAISEPADKVGLVDIYGDVWRTGGTTQRTGDDLDDFLENLAAKVETGGSNDSTVISFNCLKQDFEPVFGVFVDLLQNPAFREDKIGLAKQQMYTGISRRNDSLGSIAGREAGLLAYGRNNPYSRIAEYKTVAAVTRQDLLEWHARYVHPNNMIFGIVGDFDPSAMEARLRKAFSSWQRAAVPPPPKIEFQDPQPGTYFIAKGDVNQSAIHMLTLGITRKNPDYFAVEVMNEILGGGFSSRLFTDIRSKLGLAYSVGGGIGAGWDHPGVFDISMGTRSEATYQAIEALYKELDQLVNGSVTPEEMKQAKDSILNSFIFNFDSKDKVLLERMRYEFYGYPADFLEQFRSGIEKTTAEDVERVAKKYVHPKQLALLVVGNPDPVRNALQPLAPIHPIDITIPPPPGRPNPGSAKTPSASAPARK